MVDAHTGGPWELHRNNPVKIRIFTGRRPGYDWAVRPSQAGFLLKRRRGDEQLLSEVIVGDGESFEAALRRFNKKIQQAGILAEARRREFYERPAARRKRKEAKRRKR